MGDRRVTAVLLALALAAAAAALPAAGAPRRVYLSNCTKPEYAPKLLVLACADVNTYVQGLTWTNWNAATATARGTFVANTCTPNCAAGHFKRYAASLTASAAKVCGRSRKLQYTKVVVTLNGARPPGMPRRTAYAIFCT